MHWRPSARIDETRRKAMRLMSNKALRPSGRLTRFRDAEAAAVAIEDCASRAAVVGDVIANRVAAEMLLHTACHSAFTPINEQPRLARVWLLVRLPLQTRA